MGMIDASLPSLDDELLLLQDAAAEAGQIALRYFDPSTVNEVWTKEGDSPVSQADYAVDAFLKDALLSARPDYGWLSEETEDDSARLEAPRTFIVDPIDGTRGFLAGNRQWCISAAIVENGRPVAGLLQCPAMEECFSARLDRPTLLNGTPLRPLSSDRLDSVTASRKLNALMEERYGKRFTVHPFVPSLAYRLALVAKGEVDAAFARPGAHDWDLAAADLVLSGVDGRLTDPSGMQRSYNRKHIRSGSLLASGKRSHQALLNLAKSGGFLH